MPPFNGAARYGEFAHLLIKLDGTSLAIDLSSPTTFYARSTLFVSMYFAAAYMDRPDTPLSGWLFEKLGSIETAGLSASIVHDAYWPMKHEDWQCRNTPGLWESAMATNPFGGQGLWRRLREAYRWNRTPLI